MIKPGIESEVQWVNLHPEYYRDAEHQRLVCARIRARYLAQQAGVYGKQEEKTKLYRMQPLSDKHEPVIYGTALRINIPDVFGWDCGSNPGIKDTIGDDCSQYICAVNGRFLRNWFPPSELNQAYDAGLYLHEVIVKDPYVLPYDASGQGFVMEQDAVAYRPLTLDEATELCKKEIPYSWPFILRVFEGLYTHKLVPKGFPMLKIYEGDFLADPSLIMNATTDEEVIQHFVDLHKPGNGA